MQGQSVYNLYIDIFAPDILGPSLPLVRVQRQVCPESLPNIERNHFLGGFVQSLVSIPKPAQIERMMLYQPVVTSI